MDCHGNHAFLRSPNRFMFEDSLVSHLGGSNEQFGTHRNASVLVYGKLN